MFAKQFHQFIKKYHFFLLDNSKPCLSPLIFSLLIVNHPQLKPPLLKYLPVKATPKDGKERLRGSNLSCSLASFLIEHWSWFIICKASL